MSTDDIPNRGPQLLAANLFFAVATFVAVGLRVFVRTRIVKSFAADDAIMVAALVCFEAYIGFSVTGIHYGTGHHHADLTDYQVKTAMMFWWMCYLGYSVTMMLSKASIAAFMLRIVVQRSHIWTIYIAISLTIVAGTIFFFVSLFQCHPISYFWNKDQNGSCLNVDIVIALGILYSVFSALTDLAFTILPIFIVWNLKMERRAKIALIPIMCMGTIATVAVVVRIAYLPNLKKPDFLWETLDTAIWSTVEMGLAITAGSIATLRPLLRIAAHKLGWQTGSSGTNPSGDSRLRARSRVKTPAHNTSDMLRLSSIPKSKSPGWDNRVPDLEGGARNKGAYGCVVSVEADTDVTPMDPDHIVVSIQHSQSVHRTAYWSDSEERLAKGDEMSR